MFEAQKVQT